MFTKLSNLLDAIDNPHAKKCEQICSGFFWTLILAAEFCILLFFAYIFH